MGWNDKLKEMGGGNFTFLSTDGECCTFIVVGDPIPLTSKYQGKEQQRVGCPVVTDEGFMLLVVGKRLARKIGKHEGLHKTSAFIAMRQGAEGDVNTTYSLAPIADAKVFKSLKLIADKENIKEATEEAVAAVKDVLA